MSECTTALATSEQQPPCAAFDGDIKTSWITSDGDSPNDQHLIYQALPAGKHYDTIVLHTDPSYSSPKKLQVTFSSTGSVSYTVDLDVPKEQTATIALPKVVSTDTSHTATVDIAIVDSYPGTQHTNLAISEVEFKEATTNAPSGVSLASTDPAVEASLSQPKNVKEHSVAVTPVQSHWISNAVIYSIMGTILILGVLFFVYMSSKPKPKKKKK